MNQPKHVAIIMDGNGRWGLKKRRSRNLGHKEGLKTVERIIQTSIKNNIKYLTLYAFSTENWKRPNFEIKFLVSCIKFVKRNFSFFSYIVSNFFCAKITMIQFYIKYLSN